MGLDCPTEGHHVVHQRQLQAGSGIRNHSKDSQVVKQELDAHTCKCSVQDFPQLHRQPKHPPQTWSLLVLETVQACADTMKIHQIRHATKCKNVVGKKL